MNSIEIRKVNNGYMVLPAFDYIRAQSVTNGDEVNVFETFDALVTFLREKLEVKT